MAQRDVKFPKNDQYETTERNRWHDAALFGNWGLLMYMAQVQVSILFRAIYVFFLQRSCVKFNAIAVLTCELFVMHGYKGKKCISQSSSLFFPKIPSG